MKARSRGRKLWLACSMEKSVPWEEDRQRAGGQREGGKQQQDDECLAVFAERAGVGVAMGVGERGVVEWWIGGIGGLVRAFTSLAPPHKGKDDARTGQAQARWLLPTTARLQRTTTTTTTTTTLHSL